MEANSAQPSTLHHVGKALIAGALGSSVYYFVEGPRRSSSKGRRRRLAGGAQAVVSNAPSVGRCAALFGVMTALECAMEHLRHVEDPVNTVLAWGAANALFSAHKGPRAAARSGLMGAALGGIIGIAVYGPQSIFGSGKSSGE